MTDERAALFTSPGAGYEMRDVSRCASCHERIAWYITPKGKRAPFNVNGISHFATCPDSSQWRRDRSKDATT